jgi:DNA-directed RNA polymerase subunit M/transcription elongation factor TFIIS
MASSPPTASQGVEKKAEKDRGQVMFRFCSECSNMLYPKEDEATRTLKFTCRTCQYTEEAKSWCVYRNNVSTTAMETAGVTQDVASDPTVCSCRGAVAGVDQQTRLEKHGDDGEDEDEMSDLDENDWAMTERLALSIELELGPSSVSSAQEDEQINHVVQTMTHAATMEAVASATGATGTADAPLTFCIICGIPTTCQVCGMVSGSRDDLPDEVAARAIRIENIGGSSLSLPLVPAIAFHNEASGIQIPIVDTESGEYSERMPEKRHFYIDYHDDDDDGDDDEMQEGEDGDSMDLDA